MRSTFSGYESIRKALSASQAGLDTTGQNISNVNTIGYSRQKVDMSPIPPDSGTFMYTGATTVNIGQGVNIDGISRIRDQFLDTSFSKENSEYNTFNTSLSGLQEIESIFDEVSSMGLSSRLNDFYQKLQDLSYNTDSVEFANILRSSAQTLVEVLSQYSRQLNEIKDRQISDLGIIVNDANTVVNEINELNIRIRNQKLQGEPSNELLDERNNYLDKLSGYLDISTEVLEDGTVSIKSGNIYLLDSGNGQINRLSLDSSADPVRIINESDGSGFSISKGEIKGHLQIVNGMGSFAAAGQEQYRGIPYYEESLDNFAAVFANTFNILNGTDSGDKPLFEGDGTGNINASNIRISSGWLSDAAYITTTEISPVVEGRNDNIIRMINAMNEDIAITPTFKGTFEEFATTINSDIAVDVNYNRDMTDAGSHVLSSIADQRESVMSVSLDEEAINMLKYQKSYSAAARLMTTLDEALDTLINRTGLVGR